ncbi:MAG: lipopolysaccharide heptosyltransferase II [Gammaproteobacteria bacterium]|nr:lipopolysaccharide heptosyltransferase II [Gammaproteobacteria bacterium]
MAAGEKILVVGPAWIGDMVMAQSLLRLLRQRDPQALIDLTGPPWSVPLAARMPEVRRGIALDVRHGELAFGVRRRLGRELRNTGYDRAIVLPRSLKAALLPWFARIPVRTGFATEGRRWLLTDPRPLDRALLDQTVRRFLALGLPRGAPLPDPPPFPVLTVDADNRAALLGRLGLGHAPAVALMPGAAYGPAKQWPIGHFAGLAADIVSGGEEVWVLGSAAERPLGEHIRAVAGTGVHNLCGQTRLEDSVDLLSAARAAVTNDSGLMHVAAAAGTRVIALYGSSSPHFTPPLTDRCSIHYLALDCSPCFQRECPLGHLHCLRGITVAAVRASLG